MSIMTYNGGSVVAMKGKNCVAIACDRRFGVQAMTLTTDFEKIFSITDHLYIGMAGLATDVISLYRILNIHVVYFGRAETFRYKSNMYKLMEERVIKPKTFAHLVSSTLYEKRFGPFYAEPCIAGLDVQKDGSVEPFICSMDLIGCINFAKDFVVCGTASPNLYGMCESLYEPNMEPEDLFESISQALLNAVDRDALSGWGATVHVITKEGVTTRTLKGRMD